MALITITGDGTQPITPLVVNGPQHVTVYDEPEGAGFGGASVAMNIVGKDGISRAVKDGTTPVVFTIAQGDVFNFGFGDEIEFETTGSTAPEIFILLTPLVQP